MTPILDASNTRPIGPFTVSPIAFGCMNIVFSYGPGMAEDEAGRLLNHALDQGVTMLDTAAIYGAGASERLLGAKVMHRRSEFTLASKCVLDLVDGKRVLDGRPETIAATLDRALQRLGTDHIDLYYLHRLDRNVPIEESVGALARAREAGKIGAIGLSEMSAATIERAHAVHPIVAVQSEYSPMVRNPEVAVLELTKRLGMALVCFSPTGRGMLTGACRTGDYRERDIRLTLPRFLAPLLEHNLHAVDRFIALAGELGIAPSQLAIAWVLARSPHIIALPGTQKIAHLDENLGAATVTLDAATIEQVTAMFEGDAIRGARYSRMAQGQIDTETLPEEEMA